MVDMLKDGKAGLIELSKAAHENSKILSEQQTAGAEKAVDAIGDLKAAFVSAGQSFVVGFADEIVAFTKWLPGAIDWMTRLFRSIGVAIGGVAAAGGALFSGNLDGAVEIAKSLPGDVMAELEGGGEQVTEQKKTNEILTDLSNQMLSGEFKHGTAAP